MSDLTAFEGRKLEKLLGMGSGYVLNFSDRTYSEFFIDYRIAGQPKRSPAWYSSRR